MSEAEERSCVVVAETITPKEIHWTDDRVRWSDVVSDRNDDENIDNYEIDDDDDGDDEHNCPLEDDILLNNQNNPDRTVFKFPYCHPYTKEWIDILCYGYKRHSDAIWKSTGLCVWKAGEILCDYIIDNFDKNSLQSNNNNNNNETLRILELGSGLGLVGLVAHSLYGSIPDNNNVHVCLTDGDTIALKQLRQNVKYHLEQTMNNNNNNNNNSLFVHQLLWGKEMSIQFLNTIAQGEKYDIILGSDVIYSPMIIQPMFDTISVLLNKDNPNSTFITTFAKRNVPINIDEVLQAAESYGFIYECVVRDLNAFGDSNHDPTSKGVFVYKFKWK